MINGWKIFWTENGHRYKKNGFEGDLPGSSGALDYAKGLAARGIPVRDIHIVSKRKAFGPSMKMKEQETAGSSWCPYCIKWRDFRIFAIKLDGVVLPEDYRCPVCHISVADYWVRHYNPILIAHTDLVPVKVPKVDRSLSGKVRRRRR